MKKLLIIAIVVASCMSMSAEVTRVGNTFSKATAKAKSESIATTYEYESGGKTYPIMLSANGRAYIVKTSAKSGKEYKQYLGEEISRTICTELGVEYKDITKK